MHDQCQMTENDFTVLMSTKFVWTWICNVWNYVILNATIVIWKCYDNFIPFICRFLKLVYVLLLWSLFFTMQRLYECVCKEIHDLYCMLWHATVHWDMSACVCFRLSLYCTLRCPRIRLITQRICVSVHVLGRILFSVLLSSCWCTVAVAQN